MHRIRSHQDRLLTGYSGRRQLERLLLWLLWLHGDPLISCRWISRWKTSISRIASRIRSHRTSLNRHRAAGFHWGQRRLNHPAAEGRLIFLRIPLDISQHSVSIQRRPTTGRKHARQTRQRLLGRPRGLHGIVVAGDLPFTRGRNIGRNRRIFCPNSVRGGSGRTACPFTTHRRR